MSSPRQKIKVALANGTEKLLLFNGNAISDAEEMLGRSMIDLLQSVGKGGEESVIANLGFRQIRILLCCGMRGASKRKWQLDQVGDLMNTDMESLRHYLEAIFQALSLALRGKLPDEEGEGEAEEDGAQDPT